MSPEEGQRHDYTANKRLMITTLVNNTVNKHMRLGNMVMYA